MAIINPKVINFEDGQWPSGTTFSASYPWTIATDILGQKGKVAKSTNQGKNSTTTYFQFSITPYQAGEIKFDFYCSSETSFDFLWVYLDGVLKLKVSGYSGNLAIPTGTGSFPAGAWNTYTITGVTAAAHTLKFQYSKDSSAADGTDTAMIDNITYEGVPPVPKALGAVSFTATETSTFSNLGYVVVTPVNLGTMGFSDTDSMTASAGIVNWVPLGALEAGDVSDLKTNLKVVNYKELRTSTIYEQVTFNKPTLKINQVAPSPTQFAPGPKRPVKEVDPRFAKATEKLLERLPYWFKMRKDKQSIGAQFLNVIGFEFDDVQFLLDYAYENQFISLADETQADIIWKTTIPTTVNGLKIKFTTDDYVLEEAPDLEALLTGLPTDKINFREIFYDNPYYIDSERSIVYVRKPYDGSIRIIGTDDSGKPVVRQDLSLTPHHVWNFFDEFGLLLDTPRLYGEYNHEYKKRILQVFRRPANATKQGLINGIARELGLIEEETWKDGSKDLTLRHNKVDLNSIQIDGVAVPQEAFTVDDNGFVTMLADRVYRNVVRRVSYISGINIYEMYDKTNIAFQSELYDVHGLANPKLKYFVDLITNRVPIMWDKFVWGESFWDIAREDMTGFGVIPSFTDAKVE